MINIKVYFRKSNEQADEGFVWVMFYVNREKINFSTKVKCAEKEFDQKKNRIKDDVNPMTVGSSGSPSVCVTTGNAIHNTTKNRINFFINT